MSGKAFDSREKAEEAARKAQALVDGSRPAGADHPYLTRKQVRAPETLHEIDLVDARRILGYRPKKDDELLQGRLLVAPVYADEALSTCELIDEAGRKSAIAGGRKSGGFWTTENLPDCDWLSLTLIIGEGVATVLSASMATGYPGVAALSCGNLLAVGKALRERYPDAKIVFVADLGNGASKASEAARDVRGLLAVPDFGEARPEGATDVNDLHVARGLEAVRACIDGAAEAPEPEPVEADPERGPQARTFELTETGGAELLAARLAGDWYYIAERGKWIRWDGKRWAFDVGEVLLMAKSKLIAREFLAEALAGVKQGDRRASDWTKFAGTAQRRQARRNFVDLGKSEPGMAIPFDEFDRDRYLINCANGTLDLRTGTLRPHRREDKITRLLPWPFEPDATCPRWEKFLAEVLPDAETVGYAKRLAGYCLTGDVSEHVVVFCYGTGANGKSVFLNSLLCVVGDYGTQGPTSMLINSQSERHPTELVTLHGRRLVVCAEVPGGRSWNEEQIKSVSGGDKISARGMREDFWEFRPTHKLLISGNHKPAVRGQDEGMWRRWHLLPFERTIPEADRDPKLTEKLTAETPGILAWAVEGCLAWQREGLRPSAKVRAATADYRTESDRLAPFIEECCVLDERARVPFADLYCAYQEWSQNQGERHPLPSKAFAELLRGKGATPCYIRRHRGWKGIGLATHDNGYAGEFRVNSLDDSTRETSRENTPEVLSPVADADEADPEGGLL